MSRRVLLTALIGLILAGLFAGSASADRGETEAQGSIFGGHAAVPGEFPWLAYIQASESKKSGFSCSGTLVAPRVVLTAGHCVLSERGGLIEPNRVLIGVGANDISQAREDNEVFSVTKVLLFPGFETNTLHGDAGLFVLSRPAASPAIALETSALEGASAPGSDIAIAGWGTRFEGDRGPTVLQAATTTIQESSFCREKSLSFYPYFSAETQLCVEDKPDHRVSTCHGDSGGPAVAYLPDGTPVEVGITSLGDPECRTEFPELFTRVDLVSPWVARWIAAVELGAPAPAEAFPKVTLPFLSTPDAKRLIRTGLSNELRYRFAQGHARRLGCARVEKEKVKCGISWWQGANDYFGSATVYLVQSRGVIYWNLRYRIHWVDDHCWFHSGHRRTCVIRTLRR